MVEINFKRDNFGYYAFKAVEHAGDPLVCSACSALGMALVGTILHLEGAKSKANYSKGYINLEITPSMDELRQAKIDMAFTTIYVGLKQVESTHPDKVSIIVDS